MGGTEPGVICETKIPNWYCCYRSGGLQDLYKVEEFGLFEVYQYIPLITGLHFTSFLSPDITTVSLLWNVGVVVSFHKPLTVNLLLNNYLGFSKKSLLKFGA